VHNNITNMCVVLAVTFCSQHFWRHSLLGRSPEVNFGNFGE